VHRIVLSSRKETTFALGRGVVFCLKEVEHAICGKGGEWLEYERNWIGTMGNAVVM